jgi:extracellular factor (EF) 3-hydroxypalmitic acid methyl ester biosynthesis protein
MPIAPIDPFQFLTEADRKFLFEGARRARYRRGEFLFREGDTQPNLYALIQGWVRVERNYRGRGLAVARYGPGEVLGEIAFLEQQPAFGSVIAEEDVEADILDGRNIQVKLASDTGFASRFYQSLAVCLGQRLRQVLPGILHEDHAGPRFRLPRTGQVSERQFPQELIAAVDRFSAGMRVLSAEMDKEKLKDMPVDAEAQQAVARHCDDVVDALNRFTHGQALLEIGMDDLLAFRDVPDLARGIGAYVFRKTFHEFMQSAAINLGYEMTRGHAEDREFLDRIERNEPEGDGPLGPFIDQWFLSRPFCRSRGHSLRLMTAYLKEAAESVPDVVGKDRKEPLRLTSLAAGTAREVFALLAGNPSPPLVTCLDANADTLMIGNHRANELGCQGSITFLQANVVELIHGQASAGLGPQHVIYGLNVCDYLGNEEVALLVDWAHDLLVSGGWLILTNRDAANPDRAFIEHILDWPVQHRTRAELSDIFAGSRFGRPPEIRMEEAGVNIFCRCRKN